MFSLVKGNGHFIVRTYLFQFAAAFLGMIITATAASFPDAVFIIASVLCSLFFYYLEFNLYWELGTKNRLKVDGGRLEHRPIAVIGLTLLSNLLSLVLGICVFVSSFFRATSTIDGVEIPNAAETIYSITRVAAEVWQSFYWGLYAACHYFPLVFILFIIPVIVIEYLGYSLGMKNLDPFEKIGLRKKKKPE